MLISDVERLAAKFRDIIPDIRLSLEFQIFEEQVACSCYCKADGHVRSVVLSSHDDAIVMDYEFFYAVRRHTTRTVDF